MRPPKPGNLALHLALIAGMAAALVFLMLHPFLPGAYDAMATPLSLMVQTFGLVGLLLVPVGIPWMVLELRRRSRGVWGYRFAIASMLTSSIVVLVLALIATLTIGYSLGVLTLALWGLVLARWIPRLKALRASERSLSPVPLYLIALPLVVLLTQVLSANPVKEFSRNRVIANSGELVNEIEQHRARFGRYPVSLLALNPDYQSSVIGVDRYHYAPNGDAYNLYFQQPTFLIDNFGTREIVMYNRRDEQIMPSHVYWILLWSPEQLQSRQGWYEAHDAATPHWKYFWFD